MAEKTYEPRLKAIYRDKIRPAMVEQFGYKNALEVPRVDRSSSTWASAKR